MTIDALVRPPPSAPDDFDASKRARRDAWKDRGQLEGTRNRRRTGAMLAACGVVALAVLACSTLLAR